MLRPVKEEDIKALAPIFRKLYDDADIGESWSEDSAEQLLRYWYDRQRDLFFTAEVEGRPVGAIVAGVKPWFDGNRLIDGEIFVARDQQGKGLARDLFILLLQTAIERYGVNVMEFHTYGDEEQLPQSWYKRLGFRKDRELIIMHGSAKDALAALVR